METVSGFCPACETEVEYEPDEELDGKLFCPECGRTREMAEKAHKALNYISRRKSVKKFFQKIEYTLGVIAAVVFIGFLLLFFIYDAERGSLVSDAVEYGTPAVIVVTVIGIVRYIRSQK
jgi:hypothetical protein